MTIKKPSRGARSALGADYARVWARSLKLGNPYAKAIMLAVANYMNEDGIAWPGVGTIARDTDISEDTCVQRMRWLEEIGAIVVIKCWVDEHGRRNYERRGRVTSSEVRFCYDVPPEDIEDAAEAGTTRQKLRGAALASHDAKVAEQATEDSEGPTNEDGSNINAGPRHRRELNADHFAPGLPPVSTRPAPDSPPTPAARREELEPEDSPPNPPPGGGRANAPLYRVEEFRSAFPIPISDWQKFETHWRAMTPLECDEAITGALGYASLCRSQPKRGVEDAHRWLKNRKWQGYLVQGKTAETIAQRIEAEEGSTQWRIWKTVLRIARGSDELPAHWLIAGSNGKRATFPKALPETLIELANSIDPWMTVHEGGGQFAAWLRWCHDQVQPNFIVIASDGGQRNITVPREWPPRKDGSLGPPQDKPDAA